MRGGGINEVRGNLFLALWTPARRPPRVTPFPACPFQFGNPNSMAITLCQSLGQNIGMRWNNARSSAGRENRISAFWWEGGRGGG